jgi:transposase
MPKARLDRLLRENNVKVFTAKDFDFPKNEETQAKIRAEVDEFLQMREQWREEDRKLSAEREKLWQ